MAWRRLPALPLSRLVPQNVHAGKAAKDVAGAIGGVVVDGVHVRRVEAGVEHACDAATDQRLFVARRDDDADLRSRASGGGSSRMVRAIDICPYIEASALPSRVSS